MPPTADSSAVLVPAGPGRVVTVLFLCVWLVGWAVGEAFAIGSFFELLQKAGEAGAAGFLVLWLALWTLGGVGAIQKALVQLFGREELSWSAEGVTVRRRLGRDVHVPRGEIDQVVLAGKDAALAVRTRTRTVRLASLGTREEREALRATLRRALDLGHRGQVALPVGWTEPQDDSGRRVLVEPTRPTRFLGVLALLVGCWLALNALQGLKAGALGQAVTWGLAALAAGALGLGGLLYRRELLTAPGRLTIRTHGLRPSNVTLALQGLAVRASSDSDGDTWFELVAFSAGDERVLVRAMDDADPAVVLGRRLAAETGAPLSFAPEVEALVGPVEALPPVVSAAVDALTNDRATGTRSRS